MEKVVLNESIKAHYPDAVEVQSSFCGDDDGFYIYDSDYSYTYIQIDFSKSLLIDKNQSLWRGIAQDNFHKERWFIIVYDTINNTLEIEKELKEID